MGAASSSRSQVHARHRPGPLASSGHARQIALSVRLATLRLVGRRCRSAQGDAGARGTAVRTGCDKSPSRRSTGRRRYNPKPASRRSSWRCEAKDGQWGTAGNDAVILVSERHVDAIIAPSDGATSHLILQVSGRTRVPVASICSDSSITDAGVPWVVRVVPRTDQEAEALFVAARQSGSFPARIGGRWSRRDVPDVRSAATLKRLRTPTSTQLDQIVDASEPKTDVASHGSLDRRGRSWTVC